MPQTRMIKRVVNALEHQYRVIYHLIGCNHTVSVSALEIQASYTPVDEFLRAEQVVCPFCADPPAPTPQEIRRAKTANQLWKEAGKP